MKGNILIMSEIIFSEKIEKYLTNDMNVCVEDLTNKILTDVSESKSLFNEFLELMIDLDIPYEYKDKLSHENNRKNRDFINESFTKFIKDKGLPTCPSESKEYFILDNIRHAFINFKQGGLLSMYQGREAECWYPKVVINSFIGDFDDIESLSEPIIVYRGTSKDEYNSKNFGQSWTLSEEIANEFAFEHYSSQLEYRDTLRVILKGEISKEFVLYYSKDNNEEEVIIIPEHIKCVEVIEEAKIE
jgi:hypothetical protein